MLKALIDMGEPFISLESTGDSNTTVNTPLQYLAQSHARCYTNNRQIPDKVALLLSRGANVEARNHRGETSLHLVFLKEFSRAYHCKEFVTCHLSESTEISVLMCTAGADVCAIDDQGRSVSDAAFNAGQEVAWTKALKYCGIDINDVLAHPSVDRATSTALSSRYNERPKSVTSKLSLAEYLERRKLCIKGHSWPNHNREISSSEDDDSEDEDYDDDNERENKDSAQEMNRLSNGTKANCIPQNGKSNFTHEERKKAKLD